jgi:Skp family chaperone for outer membrane proteins
MMNKKLLGGVACASIVSLMATVPAFAAGSAQPVSVKFGYFNLALVKASYPEAAGSEALRVQAENQLRADVEKGNESLKKMQDEKKPKEEIEKAAHDLQTQINAKQQALIQLVQTQSAMATQAIATAVSQVAKEKGVDVVVDGAGVFAGGERLVNNGEDITEAVIKRLTPSTGLKPVGK